MLTDIDAFIAYVGADLKACDPAVEDPCGANRARVRLLGMGSHIATGRSRVWPLTSSQICFVYAGEKLRISSCPKLLLSFLL